MGKLLAASSRDEYGSALREKQRIIFKISDYLNQAGFTPIKTPLIERQSTFESYPAKNMFQLYDQQGDNLVLRPDMTLPVARFIESHCREEVPKQLYYIDDVVRKTPYLSGQYNQISQAGIEIIGDENLSAEEKGLAIMLAIAQKFDLNDLQIVLGDASLIKAVLANFPDLTARQQEAIQAAIEEKNISKFKRLTAHLQGLPTILQDWPLAFGKTADEVAEALAAFPNLKGITAKWQKLTAFVQTNYPDIKVMVDLAVQAPQPYYTGPIIQGFLPILGENLFSGGRYDQLLKNYQEEFYPAVGLGMNLERLLVARKKVATQPDPVVVVLAKGRVEEDVRGLLKAAGVDTSPLENPGRKLIFESSDKRFHFILVKPSDVLKYLDRGIGDIGVVGSDTIAEQEQNHYDVLDLQRGKAEFVLAAPAGFQLDGNQRHRIATKYPKTASQYFNRRGQDVELIKLEGSVELGPLTGLADAIVDISQTGDTLRANKLKVYEELVPVSTHLLVRRGALFQHQTELTKLIENLMKELKEG